MTEARCVDTFEMKELSRGRIETASVTVQCTLVGGNRHRTHEAPVVIAGRQVTIRWVNKDTKL